MLLTWIASDLLRFCAYSSTQGFFPNQFSSAAQSCPTLCDPMNCNTPGLPVHHQLPESSQTHVHLILCRPHLLPPSIFPNIRVFSNESILPIRWPKYWSFSFRISPSNDYSELISFRMDWLYLLEISQESSPTPQFKSINSSALSFLHSPTLPSDLRLFNVSSLDLHVGIRGASQMSQW